jgi:hypothetical protein
VIKNISSFQEGTGNSRRVWDLGIKPDSEKIMGFIAKIVDTIRLWEK